MSGMRGRRRPEEEEEEAVSLPVPGRPALSRLEQVNVWCVGCDESACLNKSKQNTLKNKKQKTRNENKQQKKQQKTKNEQQTTTKPKNNQ